MPRNMWRTWERVKLPLNGLVFYLPLWHPELTGATIISKDLNAHVCTVYGTTWGLQGRSFDGKDDYISLPDVPALQFGTGDFTWIKWVYLQAWDGYDVLLSNAVLVEGNWQGMLIGQEAEGGYVNDSLRVDILDTKVRGTNALSEDTWYMITVKRISGVVTTYASLTQEGTGTAAATVTAGRSWLIGRNPDTTYPRYSKGIRGEVMAWTKGLSVADMTKVYQATKWRYV